MADPLGHGRSVSLAPELADLLSAGDGAAVACAWDAFLEAYSRLLLHTAQSTAKNRETAMDAYAQVLEKLREDDFRRLRVYEAGRTREVHDVAEPTRAGVGADRRSGRRRGRPL